MKRISSSRPTTSSAAPPAPINMVLFWYHACSVFVGVTGFAAVGVGLAVVAVPLVVVAGLLGVRLVGALVLGVVTGVTVVPVLEGDVPDGVGVVPVELGAGVPFAVVPVAGGV